MISRVLIAVGGVALFSIVSAQAAGFGNPGLSIGQRQAGSIEKLRDAVSAVHRAPSVREFLKGDGKSVLGLLQRVSSDEVETTKFQHYYQGLEVIGSVTFHHANVANPTGVSVRDFLARFDLDTQPSFDGAMASSLARSQVGDRSLRVLPALKILPALRGNSARLVYWVEIVRQANEAGRDVLIDAHSGELIADMSKDIELAPIQVYTTEPVAQKAFLVAKKGFISQPRYRKSSLLGLTDAMGLNPLEPKQALPQECQTLDPQSGFPIEINLDACAKVVVNSQVTAQADDAARAAASNSFKVLNYFQTQHRRDSYDGKGADLVSLVHIGKGFANAFWSSDMGIMAYGDGDGKEFGSFTAALDVAGHEMTHGLTSETAQLIYMDESGALNEAFSDVFGKFIANDGDWAIGKKIFLSPNSKGIRDLANPGSLSVCAAKDPLTGKCATRKPYPAKMSERFVSEGSCSRKNDNCWVHVNSTIPGHAAYLMAQKIGAVKTGKLWYLVLTQYLKPQNNFSDAAEAFRSACKQFQGADICPAVDSALQEVEL